MTIQEMRTKIDEISRDIAELRACQLSLRQRLADLTCPVKVGEVHEIRGYSYTGKQGKIESILPCDIWERGSYVPGWKVMMRVLKKNGAVGDNIAEVRQDQWEGKK